jgi:hypothetical protein
LENESDTERHRHEDEGDEEMRDTLIKLWCQMQSTAWRDRRDETGGITDDTAMMGLLAVAAVAVGGIIYALVEGAANRIDLGF